MIFICLTGEKGLSSDVIRYRMTHNKDKREKMEPRWQRGRKILSRRKIN